MPVIKALWARHISAKYGYIISVDFTHHPHKGVSIQSNFLNFSNSKVFEVFVVIMAICVQIP